MLPSTDSCHRQLAVNHSGFFAVVVFTLLLLFLRDDERARRRLSTDEGIDEKDAWLSRSVRYLRCCEKVVNRKARRVDFRVFLLLLLVL